MTSGWNGQSENKLTYSVGGKFSYCFGRACNLLVIYHR